MNASERIEAVRARMGDRLAIVGHHYQSDEVIRHTDAAGDSLELARTLPGPPVEHIVFCGVYFMAESAAILAKPGQQVHIPDEEASCVMADMAPDFLVAAVLKRLLASGRRVIPLAYVNSSAAVKAVCGRFGGAVCTSANAPAMLRWALNQGDGVLFLPDKNLARNTADKLGLPEQERLILDVRAGGDNVDPQAHKNVQLFIWPGVCSVHHRFKLEHVRRVREQGPEAKVAVHPECCPEVVQAADGDGSTSYLIKYCEQAPEGSAVCVGTEINLVRRLAERHAPGKRIFPLVESCCANMAKITEEKLAAQLERLEAAEPVFVPEELAEPSRLALQRMLEACR
jgi:quinolinate synthase